MATGTARTIESMIKRKVKKGKLSVKNSDVSDSKPVV